MKYLQDADPRFRNLKIKVGAFLTVLVLMLALMSLLLGWRYDAFESTVTYECRPARADGIAPGMDVTLHGIRIGRVASVDLDDVGAPLVRLRIRERAAHWLREDASARLGGGGFLGSLTISIFPGSPDIGPLPDGAHLPLERELSLAEISAELEAQLRPILAEAHTLIEELNQPQGPMRQALENFLTLSQSLADEVPPALADARLSASTARDLLGQLASEEGDLQTSAANIRVIGGEMAARFPGFLDDIEHSLVTLKRTGDELEKMVVRASPEVQTVLRDARDVNLRASTLLEDIREIWLFKILLPQGDPNAPPREPAPRPSAPRR